MLTQSNKAREWLSEMSSVSAESYKVRTADDFARVQDRITRVTGEMVTSEHLPLKMRIIANDARDLFGDTESVAIRATVNVDGPEAEGRRVAAQLGFQELGKFLAGMIGKFDWEQKGAE